EYRVLIERARRICPGVSLSTDIIAGFCGETEDEHQDTLALLAEIRYDHAFMFMYSERPDTFAARKYTDDVPEEVKKRRLSEIIALQKSISHENNQKEIGRIHTVLVEGPSKRSEAQLCGRTDTNKMVIFDRGTLSAGVYVKVRITGCTSATLFGEVLAG
ncbi:MAG: TRAM domain-containing protein, partial [Rhodothermaceae bacterium]|nr:TRAM domain-containing protein [Rhodothermaceae bacterium]